MFVRTKKGKIFDCVVQEQMGKPIYYPKTSETNGYIDWNEVYKKSENIIDILEVGDYVNSYKITTIDENHKWVYAEDNDGYLIQAFSKEEIKSIVTKEMFSNVEYRVETN